jgi:hypothetical protein
LDFESRNNVKTNKTPCNDSEQLYALWISRDPEEPAEGCRNYASITLNSTRLYENSTSFLSSTAASQECEKSLGQEIVSKCKEKLEENDESRFSNDNSNAFVDNVRHLEHCENLSGPQKVSIEHDSIKPLEVHPIAKYWQSQIEQSKSLDISNVQCQVEGTFELAYQTLDVSITS